MSSEMRRAESRSNATLPCRTQLKLLADLLP
jgi:hypothetical protein